MKWKRDIPEIPGFYRILLGDDEVSICQLDYGEDQFVSFLEKERPVRAKELDNVLWGDRITYQD